MSILSDKKEQIYFAIVNALKQAKVKGQLEFKELPDFTLEIPREKAHGDFATNVAMLLSKENRKAPRQIAQIILDNFANIQQYVEKIEIAGPGFINF